MADDREYAGGGRHRVTDAIDLRELRDKGSITFEVPDGADAFGDDDLENEREEIIEGKKNFFKDISLKNMPLVHCAAQDALEDFDDMQSTWKRIHEGVYKKITRPGKPEKMPDGAKVWIHFMAYHEYSDEPFDSSVLNRKPFAFVLGDNRVIPGLDIAVASMELKELSQFLFLPEYAYGPLGCQPRIPENARCLFSIELLDYNTVSKTHNIFDMTSEERSELPFSDIQKCAEELKRDGKEEWKVRDYDEAVSLYSKSARVLEEYFMTTDDQESQKNKILYDLYNNLALCYISLEKPKKAINASKAAVQLPIDVKKDKPYYRMCKAYYMMGNMEEAKKMGEEALRICPNHTETSNLYSQVVTKMYMDKKVEKALYQKMLNKNSAQS